MAVPAASRLVLTPARLPASDAVVKGVGVRETVRGCVSAGDSGHRVVLCVSHDTYSGELAGGGDGEDKVVGHGSAGPAGVKDAAEQSMRTSRVQFHPQTVAGVPAKGIAKLMAPKPALCGHDLRVSYDSLVFLGHPTVLDQKQHTEGGGEALTTFTFVLVVQEGCRAMDRWKEVVQVAGNAWYYEQMRCGYLSSEIQRLSGLEEHMTLSPAAGDVTHSRLANEVRTLFDSLRNYGVAHILVNAWLNLHVRVSSQKDSGAEPRKSHTLLVLPNEPWKRAFLHPKVLIGSKRYIIL